MVTTITTTIAIMILGYMIFINHKFNKHNNVRNNSDRITRIEGLMVDNNWKSY